MKSEVWTRDQGRCQHELESGERCGSTHRVEFHHLTPWADGSAARADDLSLRCHRHHAMETERIFGDGLVAHCVARRRNRDARSTIALPFPERPGTA